MVKKCPECNHFISDTISVCPHCGYEINSAESSSSDSQEEFAPGVIDNSKPSIQDSEFQIPIHDSERKDNYKRFIFPIALGCIIIVGIFIGIKNYSPQNKQETTIVATDSMVETVDSIVKESVLDISFTIIPITSGQETDDINTTVSIDYPQTNNESLQNAIISYLINALTNDFTWGENPRPSYHGNLNDGQTIVDFFVNDKVREISEERTRDSVDSVPWDEEISIKKICETDRLVSYEVNFGGSHGGVGGGTNYGTTFRKSDGSIMHVIENPSNSQLKSLLIRYIYSFLDNDNVDMLFDEELKKHPFPAKEPFITDKGIRFIYQKYEIGAGALGVVDVTIPYSDIANYMSEEALQIIGYEKK